MERRAKVNQRTKRLEMKNFATPILAGADLEQEKGYIH
jgi:hypothetical protein